ncbi:hypothetical protein IT418_00580 [bacterium]|nr:hypothetical protein [bacterium]
MRGRRRVAVKVLGIGIFVILLTLVYFQRDSISKISRQSNFFAQKEAAPVLEKSNEPPVVVFDSTTQERKASGQVLGLGNMFWKSDYYDLDCMYKTAVNGCRRNAGGKTILMINLLFTKQQQGLQFFDGTSTTVNLKAEKFTGDYNKKGKPIYEEVGSEVYRYCTGEKYESLAMISFGPISWPTTIMDQEISTYRVVGEKGEEAQYAVIDPTNKLFQDFKPSDIIRFCNDSDKDAAYALRTIDTYNSKTPGYNAGDQMGYGILALCKLAGVSGEARDKMIKELWESEDQNVSTVTAMVGVENNLGVVKKKFHDEMQIEGLLNGVAPTGKDYINMFAWQTRGAKLARYINTTAASKLVSNLFLPPALTIDQPAEKENRDFPDELSRSSTIINGTDKTFLMQFESSKPTIVGALSGGVYYMSEKVLNGDNLAILSWDPTKHDAKTFFCNIEGNLKRCPVVRAIGGCSSAGFAQTDVRLRQLSLSAVNDTQHWATTTEDDGVARTTTRTEHILQEKLQPPDVLIERATADEIIVSTGRGAAACLPQVKKRVDEQSSKLSEKEMELLAKRMEKPTYKDQAILVSPVRTQYRAWALYDVNTKVVNDCKAQSNAWKRLGYKVTGNCKVDVDYKGDEDNNGWNAKVVKKWDENGEDYIVKPALISFNIASYYRGLEAMAPNDLRLINFKEDLRTQLASHEIYEYPEIKVDCKTDNNGVFIYWICTESDNRLLPKCSDGVVSAPTSD